MRISTNVSALQTLNNLNKATQNIEHLTKVLSTGKRINSAADDPAGFQIANRMKTQLSSFEAAKQNISYGQSLNNVTDAGLGNASSVLQEMKKLAVQAGNGTLSTSDREALQKTFQEFQKQYDSVIEDSTIFDKNLLKGGDNIHIQSGINAGQTNELTAVDARSTTLQVDSGSINLNTVADVDNAIDQLDQAINKIGEYQATTGAQASGLEARMRITNNTMENTQKSLSRIEDADMAKEASKLRLEEVKQQFSLQALQMVLQLPKNALQLLR